MKRRVFFSFHYERDNWRAAQIRNIGALESDGPVSDNNWETVTKGGNAAIQQWIDSQMANCSCIVVLIGAQTAGRKLIDYEIRKAWNDGKGLFGIYIHGLQNRFCETDTAGANPFDQIMVGQTVLTQRPMSNLVSVHSPGTIFADSQAVYKDIANNIANWAEDAIARAQRR